MGARSSCRLTACLLICLALTSTVGAQGTSMDVLDLLLGSATSNAAASTTTSTPAPAASTGTANLGGTTPSTTSAPATSTPAASTMPAADPAATATPATATPATATPATATPATATPAADPAATATPAADSAATATPAADPAATATPAVASPVLDRSATAAPTTLSAPATDTTTTAAPAADPAATAVPAGTSTAPATSTPATSTDGGAAPDTSTPAATPAADTNLAPTTATPVSSTTPSSTEASAAPVTTTPAAGGGDALSLLLGGSGSTAAPSTTPTPSSNTAAPSTTPTPTPSTSTTPTTTVVTPAPSTAAPTTGGTTVGGSAPSTNTTQNPSTGVSLLMPSNSTGTTANKPSNSTAAPGTATAPVVKFASPPTNLPPAPPAEWATLPKDTALVFNLEIKGKYIVPWTNPKTYVVTKVLSDRYIMSAEQSDMSAVVLSSFTYLSYDNGSGKRRLQSTGRELLQQEKSGVNLQVTVATNPARTSSEISSVMNGVINGTLASDLTYAGVPTENVTLLQPPQVMPMSEWVNINTTKEDKKLQGWAIALIVAAVLLLVPAPLYCLIKAHKRKRKEAIARQQAAEAAARARAQSRITKPKSFTLTPNAHHIMVRTGGLAPSVTSSQFHGPHRTRSMQSQGSIAGSVRSQGTMRFMPGERSPSRPPSRQTSLSGMPRPAPLTGLGLPSPPSTLTSPTGMPMSYSMMPSPRSLAPELSHGSLGARTLSGSLRQQHHPYSSPPPQPNHIVEIYAQGSGEARSTQ